MQSTFSGIEIGKRSLFGHQLGLTTIGNNLSNISTPGYSRQRVELSAFAPIDVAGLSRSERAGQLGQGVIASRVARIRDELLDSRIVAQSSSEGYWKTRDRYMLMLDQLYNEPTELSIRGMVDQFWDAWQEMAHHPTDLSARRAVVQRGESLVGSITLRYGELDRIRSMLDQEIKGKVVKANGLIEDIALLNQNIGTAKAAGDNPNDLLDRRDLLIDELSILIDIRIDSRDPDEFNIHSGGFHIVQGGIGRLFDTSAEADNDGYSQVVWNHSGEDAHFRDGAIASLIEIRDGDVRGEIQKLDSFTINFIDLVNEQHRSAYGLNGSTGQEFFVEYPRVLNQLGNVDRDDDGVFDSSYLFRITGANRLEAQRRVGLQGVITIPRGNDVVEINYESTDLVADIIEKINNADGDVTVRLDRNNRLAIKGTSSDDHAFPILLLDR